MALFTGPWFKLIYINWVVSLLNWRSVFMTFSSWDKVSFGTSTIKTLFTQIPMLGVDGNQCYGWPPWLIKFYIPMDLYTCSCIGHWHDSFPVEGCDRPFYLCRYPHDQNHAFDCDTAWRFGEPLFVEATSSSTQHSKGRIVLEWFIALCSVQSNHDMTNKTV